VWLSFPVGHISLANLCLRSIVHLRIAYYSTRISRLRGLWVCTGGMSLFYFCHLCIPSSALYFVFVCTALSVSSLHANPGLSTRTWVLTTEDVTEPPKRLAEECKKKGVEEGVFGVCDIGETVFIDVHKGDR
jgi:hypothetical protein